jgi:IS5 family transposase
VIQLRHRQPSLWHSGLAKDIEDLWEPWMKEVDQLLEDAALVESVHDAQGKRHRKSRTHGRTQTPAEVALRLLILKHVRNWSYDTLEREVRANLVYRAFHPHWGRESTGCQNAGTTGASHRTRSDR